MKDSGQGLSALRRSLFAPVELLAIDRIIILSAPAPEGQGRTDHHCDGNLL